MPVTHKAKVQPNCHCMPLEKRRVKSVAPRLSGYITLLPTHGRGGLAFRHCLLFTGPDSRQGPKEINFRLEQTSKSCQGSETGPHRIPESSHPGPKMLASHILPPKGKTHCSKPLPNFIHSFIPILKCIEHLPHAIYYSEH